MLEANHFGIVDYLVVIGTLLFSLLIGVYYACKGNQTNEELLVGGRKMSVWPVACSILVTYLSAITVLGYPAEIYSSGIQVFMMSMVGIIFIPLGAYLFASVFYKMKLTSVYEYLEYRFETVAVRWLASIAFILQVVIVTGVVLYAPSIALKSILGLPIWLSVVGIGVCGTVYTSIGGLKAVVWTDVFQFFMILVGMLSMVIKGMSKAGGFSEALEKTYNHGRLELFDWTVDPFVRHNTLNFFFGYGFTVLCLYGTYQPQVQRYCSLPTFKHAVRSMLLSVLLNILIMTLVSATGIAIFATYAGCDPVLLGEIKKADQIVPHFVINELANVPGMLGLFVACIFSAVLSSLSSILNSLSAVTWQDFLSRMPYFKKMSDRGQANTSKLLAVFYGIITIFFAFAAQYMGPILQATLTVVGASSGPLGAIFLIGLFLPCVNKWGGIFGMLTGLTTMFYIGLSAFTLEKPYTIPLPTNVNECPAGTNITLALQHVPKVLGEFEWPEKLFTLSYLMYPVAGASITTLMALLVSVFTGGISQARHVKKKYLHPLLHKHFGAAEEDPKVSNSIKYLADQVKRDDTLRGANTNGNSSPYKDYKYESVLTEENKLDSRV